MKSSRNRCWISTLYVLSSCSWCVAKVFDNFSRVMLGLFRRVLILKRVRDRNSLVGSSETMPRVRMLSPLPTWMSPYSLWLAVCIRHMYYFDVSVIVQSFTLRFPIAGASDQSNKVPVPTNSVSPADPANQQNVYAHSSNLLNLLRGSQENTSPSKMDVRALGKIQFGDCKRAMRCFQVFELKFCRFLRSHR